VDQNLHPSAVRDAAHQQLEATLLQMAADLRNPAVLPFSPVPLVTDLNVCRPAGTQFVAGRNECAMDFLGPPDGLLSHLQLQVQPNYLTDYTEQGICGNCGRPSQQASQTNICLVLVP
jgi:hypothetical protein